MQQPNFFQTLQQQQQIQNIFNPPQFPSYLQANPAITPYDQLVNKTVKFNVPFSNLSITIQVPNIKNSHLLAPSNTQVTNVQTDKPTSTHTLVTTATTTSNVNQKPSFSSMGPLLESLAKQAQSNPANTTTNTTTTIEKPTSTPATTSTTVATSTTKSNINQRPSFDFLGNFVSETPKAISDLAPTFLKNAYVANIVVGIVDSNKVIDSLGPKLEKLAEDRNIELTKLKAMPVTYDPTRGTNQAELRAHNAQNEVFKRADEEYTRAKTAVDNAKAKIQELEKQAPDVFAAAIKEGVPPPRDLQVVTASTKEVESGAVEMTKKISDLLTSVDLIASQIKFTEMTKGDASRIETLKKDLAYNVSLVKFTWSMLQRKPELTNLVTYKLKLANFNDLFVKVLNAPTAF